MVPFSTLFMMNWVFITRCKIWDFHSGKDSSWGLPAQCVHRMFTKNFMPDKTQWKTSEFLSCYEVGGNVFVVHIIISNDIQLHF
jgi:hypothetical protein